MESDFRLQLGIFPFQSRALGFYLMGSVLVHFLTGVTRSCLMAFLIWAFEIDWYIDLLAKLQVYMNLESILDVIAFVGESLSISISVFERVRGFAPCGIHLLSDKFMCAPPPPLSRRTGEQSMFFTDCATLY